MDVPDRLPFEVLDRLFADEGPPLRSEHHVRDVSLVITSKKTGTFRPFVRVNPLDLILFQALVDELAPNIEGALGPRDRVGAYRQALGGGDDAFEGTPRNDAFLAGISEAIEAAGNVYVLQTDISGYFLGVTPSRLERELGELADRGDVVADLADLLRDWGARGVTGLPQGLRPASPLANVYLASLDRRLGQGNIPFFRWVDDMWAICDSFSEARRVQDEIERHLYGMGLTLNGEKTRILRAATAQERLEPVRARFERKREALLEEVATAMAEGEYFDEADLPEPEDVDEELATREHGRLVAELDEEDLPQNFRADMAQVFRELEAVKSPIAVSSVPDVLRRAPDLTDIAMRYVVAVASEGSGAADVFATVLAKDRFTRDHEKLAVCHKALSLEAETGSGLDGVLGGIALDDPHPLTRAKALVAWGRHSSAADFKVVDRFLASAEPQWRAYAVIAIQAKDKAARDLRYERWAGSGTPLGRLVDEIRSNNLFKWTRL